MDQDAVDQIATLDFGLQALQGQIVVLQDGQMESSRTAIRGRSVGWPATR
jgi:hypothetical protein